MFHLDPPAGFQSFDPFGEVKIYSRNLPHWRQNGATYFVTFRLGDALPQSKLEELNQLRREWERTRFVDFHPPHECPAAIAEDKEKWESLSRMLLTKTEHWLDQGYGSCLLNVPSNRDIVADAMESFHEKHYHLGAYVVMPNHAHVLIRPLAPDADPLETILASRKRWTANQINRVNQRVGNLWQDESFDRIIRDPQHLWRTLQYIGKNPEKAGIDDHSSTRWVCPEWRNAGWDFEA